MNETDLLDPEEQALMKKPKPVGWFVAGLVFIVLLVLLAAYYLPLKSAHSTLAAEHEKLATKAGELDHALKTDRKSLAKTEARRDALQKFVDDALEEQKKTMGAYGVVEATLQRELKAFLNAKLVEAAVDESGVHLSFEEKTLFRPRTSSASPAGARTLCKATASLAKPSDYKIKVVTRAPAGDKKYWELATERAGVLAMTLQDRCEISPDQIEAGAVGATEGAKAAEVHFSLKSEKSFSPKDAPQNASPGDEKAN